MLLVTYVIMIRRDFIFMFQCTIKHYNYVAVVCDLSFCLFDCFFAVVFGVFLFRFLLFVLLCRPATIFNVFREIFVNIFFPALILL